MKGFCRFWPLQYQNPSYATVQPGEWHKNIRNITGHNNKAGDFDLPSLGVSVTEQADNLNDHFSDICCQLPPFRLESLPSYLPAPPPYIDTL